MNSEIACCALKRHLVLMCKAALLAAILRATLRIGIYVSRYRLVPYGPTSYGRFVRTAQAADRICSARLMTGGLGQAGWRSRGHHIDVLLSRIG